MMLVGLFAAHTPTPQLAGSSGLNHSSGLRRIRYN